MSVNRTLARKVTRRIAPVALAAMLGLGAAACGSSGGTRTQNAPPPSAGTPGTGSPSTSAPSNGGAGF